MLRLIITCVTETLTITEKVEEKLKIIEKKMARTIMGPKTINKSKGRPYTNHEIDEVIGMKRIGIFITQHYEL